MITSHVKPLTLLLLLLVLFAAASHVRLSLMQ